MGIWEQVLIGIGALLLLLFFWPGAKSAMEASRQAENPDWQGALLPIIIVVLFVICLLIVARS